MWDASIDQRGELILDLDVHVENVIGHVFHLEDFYLFSIVKILLDPDSHVNIYIMELCFDFEDHVVQQGLIEREDLLQTKFLGLIWAHIANLFKSCIDAFSYVPVLKISEHLKQLFTHQLFLD